MSTCAICNRDIPDEDSYRVGMCTCISPRPKSPFRAKFDTDFGDDAWDNLDMGG